MQPSFIQDIVIEIPYNTVVKYEFDYEKKLMRCDRILNTAMAYPGSYGYFPQTLAEDGDALDVLLICEHQIFPNTIIKAKIIGVLKLTDEKGKDDKIIAVPAPDVDSHYLDINDITDLSKSILSKIKHFFEHYKDNEPEKWCIVNEYDSRLEALKILDNCKTRYEMVN